MEVKALKREFLDTKTNVTYPDVNPSFTPEEVMNFLSNQYPHLTNATVEGPEIAKDKIKYKFVVSAGKKG